MSSHQTTSWAFIVQPFTHYLRYDSSILFYFYACSVFKNCNGIKICVTSETCSLSDLEFKARVCVSLFHIVKRTLYTVRKFVDPLSSKLFDNCCCRHWGNDVIKFLSWYFYLFSHSLALFINLIILFYFPFLFLGSFMRSSGFRHNSFHFLSLTDVNEDKIYPKLNHSFIHFHIPIKMWSYCWGIWTRRSKEINKTKNNYDDLMKTFFKTCFPVSSRLQKNSHRIIKSCFNGLSERFILGKPIVCRCKDTIGQNI